MKNVLNVEDSALRTFWLHFVETCVMLDSGIAGDGQPEAFLGLSWNDGGRLALQKGGLRMVTYSDLIQIGILIVGICSLIVQICKKK